MTLSCDRNILVLDCSLNGFSVAACKAGQAWQGAYLVTQREQASLLVPEIQSVFEKLEIDPKSLDAVFVTTGPGSFTGLRVAAATAQGYALAADCPVYALSSLELVGHVLSQENPECDVFAACIKSKSDDLYFQCFDVYGKALSDAALVTFDDVSNKISEFDRICFGGNIEKKSLAHVLAKKKNVATNIKEIVNPSILLGFSIKILQEGLEVPFERITYLREADISVGKKAPRKLK